jgi:hypothetical protein
MAIQIGRDSSIGPVREPELLADVQLLESCLVGPCGRALSSWRRTATSLLIKLALLGAGASKHVELREDGWSLREGAACASDIPQTLNERIAASHARDYASGRARVALRQRPTEADDRYFTVEDDEDTGEVYPVLQRFRERTAFQMQQA